MFKRGILLLAVMLLVTGCTAAASRLRPGSEGRAGAAAVVAHDTPTATAQELIAQLARSNVPIDPDCAQGSVVAFGDSITGGLYLAADEAYPADLARLLGVPVCNAGMLGDTTLTAKLRLQRDVLQFHPSVVLVLFGTNDSGVTAHDGRAPISLDAYRATLSEFVADIEAAGAVPVLLSLPPTDPARSAPGGTGIGGWAMYDAALRDVAGADGVTLVDLSVPFDGRLALLRDGIHPTAEGASVIAAAAAPAVRAAMAAR